MQYLRCSAEEKIKLELLLILACFLRVCSMPLCSVSVDLISVEFESRITLGVTPIFFLDDC